MKEKYVLTAIEHWFDKDDDYCEEKTIIGMCVCKSGAELIAGKYWREHLENNSRSQDPNNYADYGAVIVCEQC